MTIGTIMQRPAIKAERPDLAYLPPNYYQHQIQQQQQLQQFQNQQRMAPQANNRTQNHHITQPAGKKQDVAVAKMTEKDLENQPDFQSIKGVFGWTVVDKVNIPYILRGEKQFVSVRIVEMKLLNRYPNSYPDDLGKQAPLTSFFITVNEAKLLNEINLHHCAGEYGKKEFTTKDLIVLLSDFINFYNLVKKTFPDAAAASQSASQDSAGWLQIKNTVTPYVRRQNCKLVPLSVIQYAAGLLKNEKVSGLPPSKIECELLNEACKTAGVEFVFSDSTTRLINVSDILKISPIDIIELPSSNPLKHATYMELPTTGNSRNTSEKPQVSQTPVHNPRPGQPYMFQPGSQMDTIRSQIQGNISRPDQPAARFQIPPHSAFPGTQMFDPRMMDSRMSDMYRMQYTAQSKPVGQQNGHPGPMPYNNLPPQLNPMMQYYLSMQNNQNVRHHNPSTQPTQASKNSPHQSLTNGLDYGSSRSPGASSNPSPRSRTPVQTRPPSGSRQPSESPLGSPLSPSAPAFPPAGGKPSSVGSYYGSDAVPTPHPGVNSTVTLQQMQSMFLQRFPLPNVSANNQNSSFSLGMSGQSNQNFPPKMPLLSSQSNQTPGQQSANQEIPGLFSPTGSNLSSPKQTDNVISVRQTFVPPAPLQSVTNSNVHVNSVKETNSVNTVVSSVTAGVVVQDSLELPSMPAPRNQPLPTTISAAKPQAPLVNSISGNWLNNKSISCLYLDQGENRKGPFCLVEAVCKLYFNGCSVNEFLFALENVLNVPLLTCNDSEEKAFIQYYSLPVMTLKCNKMIKFDDLEKYFPQLTYMFPSKEAIAQNEGDLVNNGLSDIGDVLPVNSLLCTENVEAVTPETDVNQLPKAGEKRPNEFVENGQSPKHIRLEGADDDDDDAVIILD